jgi:hypothetical protein
MAVLARRMAEVRERLDTRNRLLFADLIMAPPFSRSKVSRSKAAPALELPSLLLELPDHLIAHILLHLTDHMSDHHTRRDSLSALAFMCTCKRLLRLVESSDAIWEAMVQAELFAPADEAKLHPARERFRGLRKLSLTGFWQVKGRYSAGETYSYEMQVSLPSTRLRLRARERSAGAIARARARSARVIARALERSAGHARPVRRTRTTGLSDALPS